MKTIQNPEEPIFKSYLWHSISIINKELFKFNNKETKQILNDKKKKNQQETNKTKATSGQLFCQRYTESKQT